jgi:hypothetical protein
MPVILLAAACISMLAAAPVSVQMQSDGVFVVQGWTAPAKAPAAGWPSVFAVYAGASKDVPPMMGVYAVQSGTLTFRPRFALSPGMRVRAVFQGVESVFDTPRAEAVSSTRVARVYPGANEVPENQLKFYIEFSAPMSRGEAWKYIRLLKSDGTPVELPFLEIDQEMWDADAKRLTVLFDPGRIKRGVKPLEDIGPAIEAGHSYTLTIDRQWLDGTGAPLMASHRKEFRVTEADRVPIDPARWTLSSVKAGTRDALTIAFREPLDAALASRLIWVEGVSGKAVLGAEEREWRFVPDQPWAAREYAIQVDTALEDLAGNKIGRPFEVDTFERVSQRVKREVISLPLRVGR